MLIIRNGEIKMLSKSNTVASLSGKRSGHKLRKCGLRRKIGLFVLLIGIAIFVTGCDAINETFGEEYRIADNYYDQLEADLIFTAENYVASSEATPDQKQSFETNIAELESGIKLARAQSKAGIQLLRGQMENVGYEVPLAELLEIGLVEQRTKLEKTLSDISDGKVELLTTTVDRGILGSIWHFIRNHWLISLIIFGVICMIGEKAGEAGKKSKEK